MPVTVPILTQFQTQSGNVPVSQLDTNITNLRNAVQNIAALLTDIQAGYGSRNLIGNNNAATPNTKYDLSADVVWTMNPLSKATEAVVRNTGVLTNDTGLASAANGRDQAAAFVASTWIHFYFIWNGTAIATLSSVAVPSTGPTLPAGYTSWAYAGAIFYNATPLLVKTRLRDGTAYYETRQQVLTAGVASVETAVSVVNFIPPNALSFLLHAQQDASNAAAIAAETAWRYITGIDYFHLRADADAVTRSNYLQASVPNLSQQFFYLWIAAGAATRSADAFVVGYVVSN